MAKKIVKVASVAVLAIIILSQAATIANAETAAARQGATKWQCNTFPVCKARSGKITVYGWRIHVTSYTRTTLVFSLNSSVYKEYYNRSDFIYIGKV